MKPYPTYKDSSLPWLGPIPAHWDVRRGKRLFKRMNRPVQEDDEVVTAFRDGMVTLRRNRRLEGFTEAIKEIGYQRICKGDLVIHAMDAFAGAIGVSDADGKSTPVYAACRPIADADPYYYAFILRVMAQTKFILSLAKGIRERSTDFRFDDFGSLELPLPPAAEQAAIVAFLDRKGEETDRFLHAKRRLIALLREQKAALITQAVTRGLNPDAPTKPSGVGWLGDVPAHWKITRLKRVTNFFNGFPFKPADWKTEGVPIIRIQNLNGGEDFNFTDRVDVPEGYLIQPGDLMFAWSGNVGTSFGPFLWGKDFPGYLNQHIFKLNDYTYPKKYFYYLLKAATRYIEAKAGGIIGLVHVTKPELGDTEIPLIPPDEQAAIVAHIDRECEQIDRAIARTEREMELIGEYRTALIAEAVTGKMDVRNAAQTAPILTT